MNEYAPMVRIALRYGVPTFLGIFFDQDWANGMGEALAADPDVVNYLALGIGAAVAVSVERWYAAAKTGGGAT